MVTAGMTVNRAVRGIINTIVVGGALFDEPMSLHTSMGVGGKTDALVFPDNVEKLRGLVAILLEEKVPFIPVGKGTNLIVRDGGYRGVLISLDKLRKIEATDLDDKTGVAVYAEAGVSCSALVDFSVKESLTGLEFCAGIPGSVGGGVKMNAGAWGRELKDVVSSVCILEGNGDPRKIDKKSLRFSYRNLELSQGAIIFGVSFDLIRGEGDAISEKIKGFVASRKDRHPLNYRSAGSVFKNPPGYPAGRIIDEMGLKGMQKGGAQISEKHGNFIINMGGANASDIIALVDSIRKRVLDEKGIMLEPEIKIIGDDI